MAKLLMVIKEEGRKSILGCGTDGGGLPRWWSGKDLPANSQDARDVGSMPGSGRSREGNATCCSILAWEIPWTEEPGGLQSMGSQRVGQDGCLVQKIVTIHSLLAFRSE